MSASWSRGELQRRAGNSAGKRDQRIEQRIDEGKKDPSTHDPALLSPTPDEPPPLIVPIRDVQTCPGCGGPRRIIAAITDPNVAAKILNAIGQARPPPA